MYENHNREACDPIFCMGSSFIYIHIYIKKLKIALRFALVRFYIYILSQNSPEDVVYMAMESTPTPVFDAVKYSQSFKG